jgi:hypothetical protein
MLHRACIKNDANAKKQKKRELKFTDKSPERRKRAERNAWKK